MRNFFVLITAATLVFWPEIAVGAAVALIIRSFME